MDRAKARSIAARCAVVLVAIGMLVYVVHYALGQFSTTLTTLPTQEITDYTLLGAEAYLFRDEQIVSGESNAPVIYEYRDGARVPKDAAYAISYAKPGADAGEAAALQAQLDAIAEQIALLEDSKRAGSLITSLTQSQIAATQSYCRVLEALASGGYLNAGSESKTLLSHLSTYSMLMDADKTDAMISQLKGQRQSLLDGWGGVPKAYV
ncbi:MAG: hypothetical protein J6V39_06875, partial [Clostridia bacterium]|nr:hypothetical protein [Clostridia bacterium]